MIRKANLTLAKAGPNALHYEDKETGVVIGKLYLAKAQIEGVPQRITVTIEY